MKCFLQYADGHGDYERMPSIRYAIGEYRATMEELARYGQPIEASIHIAKDRDSIDEYPNLVLSPGPRGGVKIEST